MMWGAISVTDRTNLVHVQQTVRAQGYCDKILQPHVLPLMQQNGAKFLHDNAKPHRARLSNGFLQNQDVQVLPWPSKSPDLKPNEQLWDDLDRRIRQQHPQRQLLQQLA